MANYAVLKVAIENVIKTNGNEEITGEILQNAIIALIESLGAKYQFAEIATPGSSGTNPGTPDYNVMYIAGTGTYPNFGGTVVPRGSLGVFRYNGEWDYTVLDVASWAEASNKLYYNTEAGSTAAKTVTAPGFTLQPGGWLKVHFDSANTAANPTLNVNNTGAHTILFNNSPVSATNSWKTGETVAFYYDNYGVGTWYGIRLVDIPDFINVNDLVGQTAPFISANAARSAILQQNRKPGLNITYLLSTGENTSQWVQDMFIGDDITDWAVADNWKTIGPVSVTQNTLSIGGNYAGQMSDTYDVTLHNSGATFASLAALLSDANLATLIPTNVRKGGMSIKFVQTSDNKYVQYRLMSNTWSTSVGDWQGVDKNLAIGSHNLIENGVVAEALSKISNETIVDDEQIMKVTSDDGTDTLLEITENGVDAKNLKSNGKDVATEDELDLKQDIIPEISQEEYEGESEDCIILADNNGEEIQKIKAETLQEDNSEGFIIASDDYDGVHGEMYAKINSNGMFLKKLFNIDGTPFFADFLSGKKWAVFGDSFTKGDNINAVIEEGKYAGENASYPWIIGNRTGINVLQFFENGRTLAFPAQPGDFVNSVTNPSQSYYYQNIPADVDYITFYLGINDSHHASGGGDGEDPTGYIPLGEITDNVTSSYYGAWNVVLSWLIENRPFAHIGIIVSNGCDSVSYREAQIAIAKKYGIPYIDLNGDERTPFMLRTTNPDIPSSIKNIRIQKQAIDPTTNTHPNAAAYGFESTFIENFLRSI